MLSWKKGVFILTEKWGTAYKELTKFNMRISRFPILLFSSQEPYPVCKLLFHNLNICCRLWAEFFYTLLPIAHMLILCNDFLLTVEQVRQLLVDDPGNSEYVDMERELKEVLFCLWLFSFNVFHFLFLIHLLGGAHMIPYNLIYMSYLYPRYFTFERFFWETESAPSQAH